MAVLNWGDLTKSQVDPETIEQAIARLIVAHNANEEAHLAVGQSLQSHKAAEIIDHLALSIIADKINTREIQKSHLAEETFDFKFHFSSIDGWWNSKSVGAVTTPRMGGLSLYTGAVLNNYNQLYAEAPSEGWAINYFKNPRFVCDAYLTGVSNVNVDIGVGSMGDLGFGFRQNGNIFYAITLVNGSAHTTEILTLPAGIALYHLEAIYTSGSEIKFYVNGVLEHTETVNLPENGFYPEDEICWFTFWLKTLDVVGKEIYLRYLFITQDV